MAGLPCRLGGIQVRNRGQLLSALVENTQLGPRNSCGYLSWKRREKTALRNTTKLAPPLQGPLNCPRCENNRSRDCNPEQVFPVSADTALACRRSPYGRASAGRASALPVLGNTCRYCRPCRVPAHPPRWVAPHSTRGQDNGSTDPRCTHPTRASPRNL